MKRIVVLCTATLIIIVSAVLAFGDIARPRPTPAGKVVFHTGLQIAPDTNVSEARLQISQETLERITKAAAMTSGGPSSTAGILQTPTQTVMAGMLMFLAISFGGVWLARSNQRRGGKAVAAVAVIAGFLAWTTVMVSANAGPPGSLYWQRLSDNLNNGKPTSAGVDIEIVPGDDQMKLIMPTKAAKKPGEE